MSAGRRLALWVALALAPYLQAQMASTADADNIVPRRFIVVYRDASLPGDAELRAQAFGARIKRYDRLGIAIIQTLQHPNSLPFARTGQPEEDDQATMRMLAARPGVEYVLHDRIVTAHHLRIRPVPNPLDPTFSVVTGPAAVFDTYYNSPQGWAVRQAGGYGHNTPGGPAHGPWDSTTGRGVRIAILDSGVDASHPDIAPNLGLNFSEVDPTAFPSVCDEGSHRIRPATGPGLLHSPPPHSVQLPAASSVSPPTQPSSTSRSFSACQAPRSEHRTPRTVPLATPAASLAG